MSDINPKILDALTQIGHSIPETFQPDANSPYHEDVQAVLASTLFTGQDNPSYRGDFDGWEIWMYRPASFGTNESGWLEIGHADGGNYTVIIPSPKSKNPAVARYDHEEPSRYTRLTHGLSTFIRGLVAE